MDDKHPNSDALSVAAWRSRFDDNILKKAAWLNGTL